MHSDLEQSQREEVMKEFKSGHIDILVATDVVARGIDINDIKLVVNFDIPHDPEDYVHRIGRTARGTNGEGLAITFVSIDEQAQFKRIEDFLEWIKEAEDGLVKVRIKDHPRAHKNEIWDIVEGLKRRNKSTILFIWKTLYFWS